MATKRKGRRKAAQTGTPIIAINRRGALRAYYPDFVAKVQGEEGMEMWLIETKGREWDDVRLKDARAEQWCEDASRETGQLWQYKKVPYAKFHGKAFGSFGELIARLEGNREPELALG